MKLVKYQDEIVEEWLKNLQESRVLGYNTDESQFIGLKNNVNKILRTIGRQGNFEWYSKSDSKLVKKFQHYKQGSPLLIMHQEYDFCDLFTSLISNPYIRLYPVQFGRFSGDEKGFYISGRLSVKISLYHNHVEVLPPPQIKNLRQKLNLLEEKFNLISDLVSFKSEINSLELKISEAEDWFESPYITSGGIITVPPDVKLFRVLDHAIKKIYGKRIQIRLE